MNLNTLYLPENKDKYKNNNTLSESCKSIFKNLETACINFISDSDAIFGAIAWLTNRNIIQALSKTKCRIILNKENYLYSDLCIANDDKEYNKTILSLYNNLNMFGSRSRGFIYTLKDSPITRMNDTNKDYPVSCIGTPIKEDGPKMHHKFMISCNYDPVRVDEFVSGNAPSDLYCKDEQESFDYYCLKPMKVWTGSYNFSKMANRSLENAIIINDENIADSYLREWSQIYPLSEIV